MRVIVVGDIHGCLAEFQDLLSLVHFRADEDELILAGDLLDRGPDSAGVVQLAMDLGAKAVLGNHEEWHLRWRNHETRALQGALEHGGLGYKNPMRRPRQYKLDVQEALKPEQWAWLEKLPLHISFHPDWIVVHAGLRGGVKLEDQKPEEMLRMRYVRRESGKMAHLDEQMLPSTHAFWTELWTGPQNVVYGHHVVGEEPAYDRHPATGAIALGIDTGACFGKRLTAAIFQIDDGKCALTATTQVPARSKYFHYTEGDA